MTTDSGVRLRTLGPVGLTQPDGTEIGAVLSQPKQLALLVYLTVANRGALCRRDSVLGVFWPEFDQDRAQAALRKALHFLRRELGDGVIVTRGDEEVGVDPVRLVCDVNEFETATSEGRWFESLKTYAGEFLAGFHVGIVEFERWRDEVAERLRRDAVQAAERLTADAGERGDARSAVRWAEVWTGLAPYDEAAARNLMSALDTVGDRPGALRAFDSFTKRLRELELEPAAETTDLADSIRNRAVPQSSRPSLPSHASPPPRRSAVLSVSLVAAAIVAIVARLSLTPASPGPTTVAVGEFVNLTQDPNLDRIGAVYQRAVRDGLTMVPRVRVLPVDDSATPPGLTVNGSYHRVGDSLEFAVEILDETRSRPLPAPPPVRAATRDPAALADVVRRGVMGAVGYYTDLWNPVNPTRPPPSWEAYTTYGTALYTTMGGWSNPAAMAVADSLYRRVIELDALYSEAYFWLGGVFSSLQGPARQRAFFVQRGQYLRMDSLAESMRAKVRPLTDFDRAVVDYTKAMVQGDYEAAVRWAEEMQRFQPSKPHVGLLRAAGNVNHPSVALAHVNPDSYANWHFDYWIPWFWLTTAFHLAGDYAGEAEAIDSAGARAQLHGTGRIQELRAQAGLGNLPRVRQLTETLNFDLAHFGGLELRAHGLERRDPEMIDESERLLRWAVDWYREAPDLWFRRIASYWALSALGYVDELVVNLEGMARDSAHLLDVKGMLGVAYARQGNLGAADSIDHILATADPSGLRGLLSLWRARIAAQRGDSVEAVRLLDQAFRRGTWFQPFMPRDGGFWHTDPDFEPLRDYEPYQRLIAPK